MIMTVVLVSVPCLASPASEVLNGASNVAESKASINDTITNVVNILMFLVGAVSVIMIIIGGIQYVSSNGDPSKAQLAKNIILYSIIGLGVAFFAYAIVSFVLSKI
jgi:hypothetical protein